MDKLTLYCGSTSFDVSISAQTFQYSMPESWVANAETQYTAMQNALKELSYDGIPFFICADPHVSNTDSLKWASNRDRTMKVMLLGDFSEFDTGYYDELTEYANKTVNFIGVPGNHDFMSSDSKPVNYPELNEAFRTSGGRYFNRTGCFTVKDESRNVKYIGFQPYVIDPTSASGFRAKLSTETVGWLIRELSVNDNYDIVFLRHAQLNGTYVQRDGTTETFTDFPGEDVNRLLKAKVSGGSGTFTDSDGVEHTYDFSKAKGVVLCTLHGHRHLEWWLVDTAITSYCAVGECQNSVSGDTIGLIDRLNKKLRIWRFDENTVYDELALDICVEEPTE